MMKKFYTYIHTRNDTGEVFYVGKGHGDRANCKSRNNPHWKNIVEKHGHASVILEYFEKESDALAHEVYLIASFRAIGIRLCNITDGGDGLSGYILTVEDRKKISVANKGHVVSAETRRKISAANTGGKMSETAKQNMSKSATGRKLSDAAKAKVSAASKGRKRSPESIEKQLASRRAGKGWELSDETRAALRLSRLGIKQSAAQIEKRVAKLTGQTRTPEQRARIAASVTGRVYTDEMRLAMSKGQTGLKRSPESVEKRAAKLRGRKMAPGVGFKRWETRRANAASSTQLAEQGK